MQRNFEHGTVAQRLLRMAIAGVLTSLLLLALDQWGPARALREFYLQNLLLDRAFARPAPELPYSFLLVNFDEAYCSRRSTSPAAEPEFGGAAGCSTSQPPSRADIARVIGLLSQQDVRAIVVDFYFEHRDCSDDSLMLARSIVDAARSGSPVFLPRGVSNTSSGPNADPTILDDCAHRMSPSDRQYLAGESQIFFGWTEYGRHPRRGSSETMAPWKYVLTDYGSPLMPSLPFLLATYLRDAATVDQMERANFIVRPRELSAESGAVQAIHLCASPRDRCSYELPVDRALPPTALRMSYRLPWPSLQHTGARGWSQIINEIGADELRANTILNFVRFGLKERPLAFVGASAEVYRDLHVTPVGIMPGHLVAANAFLDFSDGQFLRDPDRAVVVVEELVGIVALLAGVLIVFVILQSASHPTEALRRPLATIRNLLDSRPNVLWPTAVFVSSIAAIATYWYSFAGDFANGVFSFAILSAIASAFEAGQTVSALAISGVQASVGTLLSALRKVFTALR